MNARFKKWQRKWILVGIRKLRKLERNILGIKDTDPHYSSLSPIGDASDQEHYKRALDWALQNRSHKDIKNIALTGPYGSGKSTILKTYKNNYVGKDLKFLFISLATFKEEDVAVSVDAAEEKKTGPAETGNGSSTTTEKDKVEVNEKNQLLRLIETSILQQIFYHENDNKIPDSRFKKIRSFGIGQLVAYTLAYSLFLISLYVYFKPGFLGSVFKDWKMDQQERDWLHYGSILIIAVGMSWILFSSIRIIRSVTLQKLNFQNAEIGIGVNQNKSILNHHIDEILYFFSVRPYNVVIIEDLDRFKQTEIFTKLREINLLLNNSEKTRRKDIVFIYAVRDEMFTDKERTKFFDFIIPVIPIINSSNSAKMLMAKRAEFGFKISDAVIEDVAYYIDDMRLLHNICNEFYLYKATLDTNLTDDKLFAIITYKNILPQQFVLLSNNSGIVFEMIHSKQSEIKIRTTELNGRIADLKAEIQRLDDLFIKDLKDLRLLYLVRLIPRLKNFKNFSFENTTISLDEMTEEDNFAHLENGRMQFEYRYNNAGGYFDSVNSAATFDKLEKLVDPERSYQDRVAEIADFNSGRKKNFQQSIQELEREKEQLRNLPVAEVMKKNPVHLEPGEEMKLENILIRNGYISEDYLDYISLFHDGDISRTDYQFLLKLKNAQPLEMGYKLQKTERVISKINLLSFNTHSVLNYDLVDMLLAKPEVHADPLGRVLQVLKDESKTSVTFISSFLEQTQNLPMFLRRLSKVWPNIWSFFESYAEYTDDQKSQLFTWLIMHLENEAIEVLSKHYDLTKKISTDPRFPQVITDQDKIKDLLKKLAIKFHDLDMQGTDAATMDYILQNDHYHLNVNMLAAMMKKYGKYDTFIFQKSNYQAVKNSDCAELISYVDQNINEYVEGVYLRLQDNTSELEDSILLLLNNDTLKPDLKRKIIARMDISVSSLATIKKMYVIAALFNHYKIVPSWDNIRIDFLAHDNELSQEVIDYLNTKDVSQIYSDMRIPNEGDHRDEYMALCRKLAEETSFNDRAYEQVCKAISFWFFDLDLSGHAVEQVEILVKHYVIRPVKASFDWLKLEHSPLHILLIERSPEKILEILDELTLDADDIERILRSLKIPVAFKTKMLTLVEESLVSSNPESLKHLVRIMSGSADLGVSKSLVDAALLSTRAPVRERLVVLLSRKNPDAEFLTSFISTLNGDYLKINDRSKRPTFEANNINKLFLQMLKDKVLISSFPEHKGEFKVYHKTK